MFRRAAVLSLAAALLWTLAGCGDDAVLGDQAATTTATAATTSAATGGAGAGGEGQSGGTGGTGGTGGSGGSGGQPSGGGGSGPGDTCDVGWRPARDFDGHLRVVAANLSSGNNQSYDLGHGVRILQGLDADVVLLQEMNFGNSSVTAIDSLVEEICGVDCRYVRGPDAQIPNGVLSRLPILECGSWPDPEVDNRNFVWARIDVPGNGDLWAISVHLLTSSASARALEAAALLEHIDAVIPAGDLVVLGGDLNTNSRGEAAVDALGSLFITAGPHPADQDDNDNTNGPRSKPYDWVVADGDLILLQVPVVIGQSSFPAGAVIDTRVYQPLAEIAPAQLGDSDAPSMQHMAVVKDFFIDPDPI